MIQTTCVPIKGGWYENISFCLHNVVASVLTAFIQKISNTNGYQAVGKQYLHAKKQLNYRIHFLRMLYWQKPNSAAVKANNIRIHSIGDSVLTPRIKPLSRSAFLCRSPHKPHKLWLFEP